jgi:hypothetical protein
MLPRPKRFAAVKCDCLAQTLQNLRNGVANPVPLGKSTSTQLTRSVLSISHADLLSRLYVCLAGGVKVYISFPRPRDCESILYYPLFSKEGLGEI